MRKLSIVGIGAGNPDHITVQAIKALSNVDVIFLIDKGEDKEDLAELRKDICARYVKNASYRIVEAKDLAKVFRRVAMSLTIELSEPIERDLARWAKDSGQTAEAFLAELAERFLTSRRIDVTMAPFRKQVAESGMTEGELDDFFQELRQEVWAEQQGANR